MLPTPLLFPISSAVQQLADSSENQPIGCIAQITTLFWPWITALVQSALPDEFTQGCCRLFLTPSSAISSLRSSLLTWSWPSAPSLSSSYSIFSLSTCATLGLFSLFQPPSASTPVCLVHTPVPWQEPVDIDDYLALFVPQVLSGMS